MFFKRANNLDVFWGFNLFLFLWMCHFSYAERFIEYRGAANLHEFSVYAVLTIVALGFSWRFFRDYQVPSYILIFVQAGIFIHFSGGLIVTDGFRLYDTFLIGIRFDKYVHFLNAFTAAIVINYVTYLFDIQIPRFRYFFIVLVVLGLGAIIEIIEYLVMLTIPSNGIGDYHNNMQDLIANLGGCTLFLVLLKLKTASKFKSFFSVENPSR